jgi:phage-related protein
MKICIRYDLSVDLDCKDSKDYLFVEEVNEEDNSIQWKRGKYVKKVVKWS